MTRDIHILELIRREKLEKILQGFTEVAGVASIIADAYGRPLTEPYNFTPFCLRYCRSTEEGRRRCHLSDQYGGMQSLHTGKAPIYHCLNAGLMDCAAPIVVEGYHLATILCGQVLEEPVTPDEGQKRARSINVTDIDGYLRALETVPLMSRERLLGIANLMAVITQTISELALQKHLQHKHSQRYLHKLINSVSDCIISTNVHGIISIINETGARLFGYDTEELIGKSVLELFLDEDSRQAYRCQLDQKLTGGARLELNAVKSDCGSFPAHVSIAGIAGEDANSADYVTVIRDISEERKIERMKEDLIGMVAHDIKNPTLSMQKAIELLVSGALGPLNDTQSEVLHLALDTSHQLYGMVSNLLDIYRTENGQFLLDKAVVDVNRIIGESVERLRLLAQDRRVAIQFKPLQDSCVISGDGERLTRVCVNLLENAVKYSPEEGDVSISSILVIPNSQGAAHDSFDKMDLSLLHSGKPYIRVAISDQGPGVSKEYHHAIFEKFFTIRNDRARGRTGLGLGLTFCRQVIEAHGGAIWVKSPTFEDESGGMGGCEFQFILPAIRQE